MPIYEYECAHCHHRFELKQGFDAEPLGHCPRCSSVARRLFSPVGIVFRGEGFYATDSRPQKNGEDKPASTIPSSSGDEKKEATAPQAESTQSPS